MQLSECIIFQFGKYTVRVIGGMHHRRAVQKTVREWETGVNSSSKSDDDSSDSESGYHRCDPGTTDDKTCTSTTPTERKEYGETDGKSTGTGTFSFHVQFRVLAGIFIIIFTKFS